LNDSEQKRLIDDIGRIADRVRAIRAPGMDHDGGQIKALEAQSRTKWEQLRALRAGPINTDLPAPSNRSNRR
jgi:hypothetical protein